MFKIGDFARINKVSIKTLHHYDDLGILQPETTDIHTGYRYYSADQMRKLNQILAFKEAGFSLSEIANIFKDIPSPKLLVTMLEEKAVQLEETVRTHQERLARLRTNIFLIKNGGIPIMNEITVKKVEPILIASLRATISNLSQLMPLWEELNNFIDSKGIKKVVPCMTLFYNPWSHDSSNDVEVAEPVVKRFEGNGKVKVYELARVNKMACLIHQGPFKTIPDTYIALSKWVKENGYEVNGPAREIYHKGDWVTDNPEEYVTEIQFPLKE